MRPEGDGGGGAPALGSPLRARLVRPAARAPLLSPLALRRRSRWRFRLPTPRLRSSLSPPRRRRWRRLLPSGAPGPARSPPLSPPPPRAPSGSPRPPPPQPPPPGSVDPRAAATRRGRMWGREAGRRGGVPPEPRRAGGPRRVGMKGPAGRRGGESPGPAPRGGRAAPLGADPHPEPGQRREPPGWREAELGLCRGWRRTQRR